MEKPMLTIIRNAIMTLFLLTVLTGGFYPLAVTVISQAVFPTQANGSIIVKNGNPVGSVLLGQQFDEPRYFWGRLSATTPYPYNASSSSGSNWGQNNPDLLKSAEARIQALHAADPSNYGEIPVDLVTASGSGLDPHISLAAAAYQVKRVAKIRGLNVTIVSTLVGKYSRGRWLGMFGEPVVNVLELNMALDELQ
jgi:K+-transporting ATPase ATPase C chain